VTSRPERAQEQSSDSGFAAQVRAARRNRDLINKLASWRVDHGLSQGEVAKRMHTSQPAVARLETHQHDAQLSTLARYVAALGLRMDFVLKDSETGDSFWTSTDQGTFTSSVIAERLGTTATAREPDVPARRAEDRTYIQAIEDMPDVSYADIGGLGPQIEQIRDAIELPYLHADLLRQWGLRASRGVLLYGPPGCGKTLLAKAVANSVAKQVTPEAASPERGSGEVPGSRGLFLSVKGPELLSRYRGEAERQIRLVFQRAREEASEGTPVVVFFDEMDSIFRTRDSGMYSEVENAIVAQLLSELDDVEGLQNIIVIGATNREDLIDPAILRPGRLDMKINIGRPDAETAIDIFSK
jgi:SpoVK/Ycf46/Vps4 family AAA+-type ATPase